MIKKIFSIAILTLFTLHGYAQTNKEYISVNKVKLNGKISFPNKWSAISSMLGGITRTDKKAVECGSHFEYGSKPSYYVYSKGIGLEKCGNDVFLCEIDFVKSPTAFLAYPGGKMDATTTLTQLKKLFPLAAKEALNAGHADELWIQPGPELFDDWWVFTFKQGKLVSIRYLIQC